MKAKRKKNVFSPVKEQFLVLLAYIEILEKKKSNLSPLEMTGFADYLSFVARQCEIYLMYRSLMNEED